ncbi:MAG: toll/interleukin-1 receptor domain-containing protein [Planctomycetota bacterium]
MTKPREVFLSHSHQDVDVARRIQRELRRDGIRFWFAPHRLVGSQRWHDEIGKALDRCDWFLLLLSPHAVRSRWVKHELLFALNADHFEHRIVPVLYRDCRFAKLSWTLDQIQRVDFRGDFAVGIEDLRRVWGLKQRQNQRLGEDTGRARHRV